MDSELEKRKEEVISFLKEKRKWLVGVLLAIIVWIGVFIRTRNIPLTQWKYPPDLDSYIVLRYADYYLQHGSLMALDMMRCYPLGFNPIKEFTFISAFIANLHKFLNIFIKDLTIIQTDIIYPVLCFAVGIVFFYIAVKGLFNERIALLSTAFLTVVPTYLYRTMAGVSDKEALAMMLLLMAFAFFVLGWKAKTLWKNILFGALAGLFTALTSIVWGGGVYIFLIIGLFGFIEVLLKKFTKSELINYGSWIVFLTIFLISLSSGRFNLKGLMVSLSTGIGYLAFFIALINFFIFEKDILKIKEKITKKIPPSIFSFLAGILFTLILTSILFHPAFIINQIKEISSTMIYPLQNRWALTVAESHQPYANEWFSQMGKTYIWAFILGSAFMFYRAVRKLEKKGKYILTLSFLSLVLAIIFSRYSESAPVLNGVSPMAKFLYLGSIVIFAVIILSYYLYSFYKNKENFEKITEIKKEYIFAISWFIIMLMSARSATRLIFVFSTASALIVGYFGMTLLESSLKIKDKIFKYSIVILVLLLLISSLSGFTKDSYTSAKYTGPSYNAQWQKAGDWIKANTPKTAVFAHWWDYGYWVQTGFERATITDGGNVIGVWNHFMGRYVLTGQNEAEALTFLKPHNATHLLMVSDEVGKYPAFSSIGSDENYDRYSWITNYDMDETRTQETRDGSVYLYTGGTVLDEDFTYEGKLFPARSSGIVAFLIRTQKAESKEAVVEAQAILYYNGEQTNVPLNCVFINQKEIVLSGKGLNGCLRIIPRIDSATEMNMLGSSLYLSPRVRRTLFTHLYLYGEESQNFKIAYTDESSMPLAIYQGRLIGPLKIWSITYPSSIKYDPVYVGTDYPNINVTRI